MGVACGNWLVAGGSSAANSRDDCDVRAGGGLRVLAGRGFRDCGLDAGGDSWIRGGEVFR